VTDDLERLLDVDLHRAELEQLPRDATDYLMSLTTRERRSRWCAHRVGGGTGRDGFPPHSHSTPPAQVSVTPRTFGASRITREGWPEV
jgi:hypothetical protein